MIQKKNVVIGLLCQIFVVVLAIGPEDGKRAGKPKNVLLMLGNVIH